MARIEGKKRLLLRLGVVVAILLIAVWMFFIGKMHTILLDNKTLEAGGQTYKAFQIVEVQVDKTGFMELAARDRDKVTVKGQGHKVTVRYMDEYYEDIEKTWKFSVPLGSEMMLLSIPALVGGAPEEVWLTPFTAPTFTTDVPVEEAIQSSEDASLLGEF